MKFAISDEARRLGIHGAFIVLDGIDNSRYPYELSVFRDELSARLIKELVPGFIEGDPVLRGFRQLHDAVGRSNRRFPSSAEALVALFQRRRYIPRVNALVDIYNAVSLETRLSLGAHDVTKLHGDVTLKIAQGGERFVPLGAKAAEPVGAGEYVYVDGSGDVICRLEHRQCEQTKVTETTTASFYIIQGNPATDEAMVRTTLSRLERLTRRFCGGEQIETRVA